MTISPLYIGLDVGGTSMKAGVVDDVGRPLSAVSLPTEAQRGQEFGLEPHVRDHPRRRRAAAGVAMERIAAIGVATPGTMDIPAGMILDPVEPEAVAERAGAAARAGDVRPADGVPERRQRGGLRRVLGGRGPRRPQHGAVHARHRRRRRHHRGGDDGGYVVEGEHSHGAEVGHIKIEMTNPRQCGCGRLGCLEAYASATAVVKRTQRSAGRGRRPLVAAHGIARPEMS